MLAVNIEFELERETKGTVRYKEVSESPIIGTLYVSKTALGSKRPAKLKVTINAE